MANIKSAIKRIRQTKKRKARNLAAKSAVKEAFRKASAAVSAKSGDAKELVRKAGSAIDKAVERGIIHRNVSARKKSRLQRKYNLAFKK
jgi:small subunit ribosomal protein S20